MLIRVIWIWIRFLKCKYNGRTDVWSRYSDIYRHESVEKIGCYASVSLENNNNVKHESSLIVADC